MARDRDSIHSQAPKILTYQTLFPVIGNRDRKVVNWPLFLDETVAELLGMLIHNGKVTRSENTILVRNTTIFFGFREKLEQLLLKLDLTLNEPANWKGLFKMQRPEIISNSFTKTFLDILNCDRLTQLLGIPNVPECITNSPLSVQYKFLVGYLSTCPKSFQQSEGEWTIKITPFVPTFALDIHKMLKWLKIQSTVSEDRFVYSALGLTQEQINEAWNIKKQR